jgi:hypothetical protein
METHREAQKERKEDSYITRKQYQPCMKETYKTACNGISPIIAPKQVKVPKKATNNLANQWHWHSGYNCPSRGIIGGLPVPVNIPALS